MNKITLLICLSFFSLAPFWVHATHEQGSYISYTVDPQNARKFHFKLTAFTVIATTTHDTYVEVHMGDGNTVRVALDGYQPFSGRYVRGTYSWTYTYEQAGNFTVFWLMENRYGTFLNAPLASLQPKVVRTKVRAGYALQNTEGIKLAGAPMTYAYVGEPWSHNLLAYDADGDYLVYKLVSPLLRNAAGQIADVPSYEIPAGITINEFGEMNWQTPSQKGDYILVVRVTEVREGAEIGFVEIELLLTVTERTNQPSISLLNKERLHINEDGSIQVWPGQAVKLEFYLQRAPADNLPLVAKAFGELDTLQLVDASLLVRDTVNGFAVTYTFTPPANLERKEPYLTGIRGIIVEKPTNYLDARKVEYDWAFAYLFIGEQRRPLSSGDTPLTEPPKLYPNPARDEFILVAPNLSDLQLQLLDLTGKVMESYRLIPGRNKIIRPARLASGLYTYILSSRYIPIETGKLVLQ